MKTGRHRIYTNEQRKARNREAQAAFRDRRKKHTKTLEDSIIRFEMTFKDLKESNIQTTERAEQAEERCRHLESQLSCLQKLVQTVLIDNQKLQHQLDTCLFSNNNQLFSCLPQADMSALPKLNTGKSHHISLKKRISGPRVSFL